MDGGFGKLLMHTFVIIIVLQKLELEAPRQRESFRIQIRVWDGALKLWPFSVFGYCILLNSNLFALHPLFVGLGCWLELAWCICSLTS